MWRDVAKREVEADPEAAPQIHKYLALAEKALANTQPAAAQQQEHTPSRILPPSSEGAA